ncbi:MAG: chorismate mutase [Erysipelotrichaceae bacterium]|nr:chorismate mutase [Erysipelotrichaceae bacterium]
MKDLKEARLILDGIDTKMKELFLQRMSVVKEIAVYKKENGLAVYDPSREAAMKERLAADLDGEEKEDYLAFLEAILTVSKGAQKRLL